MNSLLALAIDIVLCVLLIPRWGITGAAVAWAVANVTRCALALVQVAAELHVVSLSSASASVAVACGATIVAPLVVVDLVFGMTPLVLAVVGPACATAYVGALWLNRRVLMLGALRSLVGRST